MRPNFMWLKHIAHVGHELIEWEERKSPHDLFKTTKKHRKSILGINQNEGESQ